MSLLRGSSEAEIDAGIEACWAVVADLARAPEWQQGLERVTVVERDPEGRPLICDTTTDAKVTKVSCRVRLSYDPPHRVTFTGIGPDDDVERLDGSWELSTLAPQRTGAVFRLALDPGPVGLLARPLERALRPLVVGRRARELAHEVARRADQPPARSS